MDGRGREAGGGRGTATAMYQRDGSGRKHVRFLQPPSSLIPAPTTAPGRRMPATSKSRTRAAVSRRQPRAGEIPRRPLGSTGEEVSALGLGGYHVGTIGNEREAIGFVREAIDAGITFMDNAW